MQIVLAKAQNQIKTYGLTGDKKYNDRYSSKNSKDKPWFYEKHICNMINFQWLNEIRKFWMGHWSKYNVSEVKWLAWAKIITQKFDAVMHIKNVKNIIYEICLNNSETRMIIDGVSNTITQKIGKQGSKGMLKTHDRE